MGIVCGIDPGLGDVGWAVICDGELTYGLEEVPAQQRTAEAYTRSAIQVCSSIAAATPGSGGDVALIEQMIHYPNHNQGVDPNDLIALAYLSGAVAMKLRSLFSCVRLEPARSWKGQTPKHVTQNRVEAEFGVDFEAEFGKTDAHNVYDAVGMAREVRRD